MSLIKIRFEVANETQFSRAFQNLTGQIEDLTKPFQEMQDDFYATMGNVFAAEGAFEGRAKWVDLSPSYARWKARHFPGKKILERSGRLKTSVTVPGGPDNINSITKTEMIVGTRVPYAIVHHKGLFRLLTNKSGWTLPSAHVTPQRKIIELTSDQRKRWVHIMHNYLYGLYKEAAAATKEGVSWT